MRTITSLSILLAVAAAFAQQPRSAPRAPLPEFRDEQVEAVFFPNVFSKLLGERPASPDAPPVDMASAPSDATPSPSSPDGGWAQIISATTLEDEVKVLKRNVDQHVTTPSSFAGRGHQEVRRDFSLLAMLFAIVAEYEGQVRWKDSAALARQNFARSASNAKAGGNSNVFKEAKLRQQELDDLLRGSRLSGEATEELEWGSVADRAPLMQRLESAGQQRLLPWTSSEDALSEHASEVLHEAEIVAAIAELLTREGMEDAGDEDYDGFARQMKRSALAVVAAVKQNDHQQARTAVGEVTKACSSCHELYR